MELVASIQISDVMIDGIDFAPKLIKRDVKPDNQALLFFNAVQGFLIGFRAEKPPISTFQSVEIRFFDKGENADIQFEFTPPMKSDVEFEQSISQTVLAVHMILKKLRERATTKKTRFTKISKDGSMKVQKISDPNVN